jgi:hypothetical protein
MTVQADSGEPSGMVREKAGFPSPRPIGDQARRHFFRQLLLQCNMVSRCNQLAAATQAASPASFALSA